MQPLHTTYAIISYLHIYTVKHCFNFFKYIYTPKNLTQFLHLFFHCHHRFFFCCKSLPSKHLLFLQNLPQPYSSSSLLNFFTNDSIFSPFFSSFFSSVSFSSALLAFGSPSPPPQSSLGALSPPPNDLPLLPHSSPDHPPAPPSVSTKRSASSWHSSTAMSSGHPELLS